MSQIYRLFGLTKKSRSEKRYILVTQICPLHERLVSDPGTDCSKRVIEVNPLPVDPDIEREVKEDAQNGLIPIDRALVYVGPPPQEVRPPARGLVPREIYPLVGAVPPRSSNESMLRGIFIGVLISLFVVVCLALAGLVVIGPERIASLLGPHTAPTVGPVGALRSTSVPTVAAPTPIPTIGRDQQNPPPGSDLPLGRGYSKNGVTVTVLPQIDSTNSVWDGTPLFGFQVRIDNNSGSQIPVLWRNSFVHARDDKGHNYPQLSQNNGNDWGRSKQFTIDDGEYYVIRMNASAFGDADQSFAPFAGAMDPAANYLIFSLDQFVGMKNLTWKYPLQ